MHPIRITLAFVLLFSVNSFAHEGHSHLPTSKTKDEVVRLNTEPPSHHFVVAKTDAESSVPKLTVPELAELFAPYSKTVNTRFDRKYLYVESNGMPDHPMMIGITAWQQQLPLPQAYTGSNAWRIPLNPVPAKTPMSTKEHFFRGAIAIAVNGVPIFNPIKNDGKTDTLKAGELDQWGGHCGRADDYHYHVAPVHLEKLVGVGNAVAVALDGYPIYGYNDPNGKPPTDLDWLNGHRGPDGKYHYHATKTFPYLNGGFFGEVVEQNGQVDPQPRTQPLRPSLTGLKGASINGFENPKPNSYAVLYDVHGDKRSINYSIAEDGSATFNFVSQQGTTTETYTPRERRDARFDGGRNGRPDPKEKRPKPVVQTEARQDRQPRRDGQGGGQRRGGGSSQGGGNDRANGQRQRGGGSPIVRVLDSNRDGNLDAAEIKKASAVLLTLDVDNDGQVTKEELRMPAADQRGGPGRGNRDQGNRTGQGKPDAEVGSAERPQRRGRQGGNGRTDQAGGPRGPQPDDGPRQPWILVHADEIDIDKNRIISRDEIVGEASQAFAGYDSNNDGNLSGVELSVRGGSRNAMGGFLKGHSKEIDRDGDGVLTRTEAVGNAERMFAKMDANGDGKITSAEMEASRRK